MPFQTLASQRLCPQAAEQLPDLVADGEYPVDARLPDGRVLVAQLPGGEAA